MFTEDYLEFQYESSMSIGGSSLLGTGQNRAGDFEDFSELMTSIQGRHFTPPSIFQTLGQELESALLTRKKKGVQTGSISICDPFAGDGRLVLCALEYIYRNKNLGIDSAHVELWDVQFDSVEAILRNFQILDSKHATKTHIECREKNSFLDQQLPEKTYDVVVTNPPWATVKPKKNKGTKYTSERYEQLTKALREFDSYLAVKFPHSQPTRKFAGWGTNLSRVGCELSMNLVDDNGVLGIVLPVSFLADEASSNLRKYVFNKLQVHTVDIYSAEDRLFEFADIGVATFVGTKNSKKSTEINITWKDKESKSDNHIENSEFIRFDGRYQGNSLPVNFGRIGIKLQETLKENATFQSLENQNFIWAGREVDETGLKAFLGKSGNIQLAKGGNISSYSSLSDLPWLEMAHDEVPKSINKTRIGWRDVSRASQKRRIIATLIPEGILTGNSLNITYIKNEPRGDFIYWLLAIMSSLVFESQLRSILATDHVSLSAIRRVAIPSYLDENYDEIVEYSKLSILEEKIHPRLECLVAHSYKMKNDSWLDVLNAFPKLTEYERDELMQEWMSK